MFDKALNQAPLGIDALADEGTMPELDALEIDIEPEDGEEEYDDYDSPDEEAFDDNLAEYLSDSQLHILASDLLQDYEDDVTSRADWLQVYVDGIELLGMKMEERSEPWEGACGVYHPLLSEAVVKFQAETMMATFPAGGCVKTQLIGKETPDKKAAAARVQEDMNYQLLEVMTEYRPEHERMLWGLGLSGNAFKKVYYDPALERQVSMYITAEDLVVPYGASNIETAPRITHVMRKTENELRRLQVAGFYRDEDLGEPSNYLDDVEKKIAERMGFNATSDNRYKLLEMHVELDLVGFEDLDESGEPTGIALPYVVTIEKTTATVLAIRRNWDEDDTTRSKRQHFVHYGYVPGFGFYNFGLIHLVGAFAKSGTSLIRQLVDAGTLSNLPGGFKARGLRVKGDDTPIAPGEFRDVDVPSGTIRDNLMPLPYKEPSQVLMALLNQIVEEGRRFANAADLQISDMSGQAPVGTTLAILERTLKVMSAVQARIHYSMRQELRLLKGIIADYAPDDYNYEPDQGSRKAKRSDYQNVDVIPVSDPNASTMAQKIVQYQAALQLAQGAPQLYNLPLLHRQMLDVLGIQDAQKLVPMDEDAKPVDPVTENQNILKTRPLKAFTNQDHQAHIMVHTSMLKDPKIMGALQGNPMLPAIQAAGMAHIAEHLGFQYRKDMEQQLGMALPVQKDISGDDIHLDPDVEANLSPILAQAAQQLAAQHSKEAAQQKAQQQMQDPLIQMQMQELQLKAAEQKRKEAKDQADIQIKQQELQIERERISSTAGVALSGQQAQAEQAQLALQVKATTAGQKLKVDTLKNAADMTARNQLNAKTLEVNTLKAAAEMTHKKQQHDVTIAHQGFQDHLNRADKTRDNAIKFGHEAVQKFYDRTQTTPQAAEEGDVA
jgi:hypothetical protein